jgi:ribose transport system permease protein
MHGDRFGREWNLLLAIFIGSVAGWILFPEFLTRDNLSAVMNNIATDGFLAIGMMLLMIAGMFDLSVGSMLSLAGVVGGLLMVKHRLHPSMAVPITLACAACGGWVNGWVVARVKVNALITTLGTMSIFAGIAVLIAGPSIPDLPQSFTWLGERTFTGLQRPVILLLALTLAFQWLLSYHPFFRQYYFIGSNPKAASLSGMKVPKMQIIAFVISGLLAGLAGLAFAAKVGASVSTAGLGYELRAITAVVLGGASLSGGKGTIVGALIGVVFIALVRNILLIAQVNSLWEQIIVGVILVIAVALDSWRAPARIATVPS